MNDKSLKKLKTLWEKLDNHTADYEENQNEDQNSLDNGVFRYKPNSKWMPPNFAEFPVEDYESKPSKLFSMAYNEDKKTTNSLNVNWFLFLHLSITCLNYCKVFILT